MRGAKIEIPRTVFPSNAATLTRVYDVITPIFGGGAVKQQNDPHIIRGSSIRGHLRFWWRATRGGAFNGDLDAMRAREMAIWGVAANHNAANQTQNSVGLSVEVLNRGKLEHYSTVSPTYVAFPLQSAAPDKQNLVTGVQFKLDLFFRDDVRDDVQAALWAWEMFGGIGGRTRRGFGAISAFGETLSLEAIRLGLQQHVVANGVWAANIPHLESHSQIPSTPSFQTAFGAWDNIVMKLKRFRQWRENDNPTLDRSNPRDPKMSLWGEPDTIRFLQQQKYPDIHPTHDIREGFTQAFPRAQFGLPITFKFKQSDVFVSSLMSDPQRTTLELTQNGRFSSPLILRPVLLGQSFVGIAVVLSGSRVPDERLWLRDDPDSKERTAAQKQGLPSHPIPSQAVTSTLNAPAIPMQTWSTETDVLQAFLDSFDNL